MVVLGEGRQGPSTVHSSRAPAPGSPRRGSMRPRAREVPPYTAARPRMGGDIRADGGVCDVRGASDAARAGACPWASRPRARSRDLPSSNSGSSRPPRPAGRDPPASARQGSTHGDEAETGNCQRSDTDQDVQRVNVEHGHAASPYARVNCTRLPSPSFGTARNSAACARIKVNPRPCSSRHGAAWAGARKPSRAVVIHGHGYGGRAERHLDRDPGRARVLVGVRDRLGRAELRPIGDLVVPEGDQQQHEPVTYDFGCGRGAWRRHAVAHARLRGRCRR